MAKRKWRVKCPRCKEYWYLEKDLQEAPMYQYCPPCKEAVGKVGEPALRAKFHTPPTRRQRD